MKRLLKESSPLNRLSSRPERVARSGEIAAFVLVFLVVILREAEDLLLSHRAPNPQEGKPGRSGLVSVQRDGLRVGYASEFRHFLHRDKRQAAIDRGRSQERSFRSN